MEKNQDESPHPGGLMGPIAEGFFTWGDLFDVLPLCFIFCPEECSRSSRSFLAWASLRQVSNA